MNGRALDRMMSLLCGSARTPHTSSPLGCESSGCSCCHRSLVSECLGRQGRTHLDMIKLEMKRTKSRQSGWQACGPFGDSVFSSLWPSLFFSLSCHFLRLSSFLLPSILSFFLPRFIHLFPFPQSFLSSSLSFLPCHSIYCLFFSHPLCVCDHSPPFSSSTHASL